MTANVNLYRLEVNNTATGAKVNIGRLEVQATPAAGAQVNVTRLEVRTPTGASAGPDQTNIEPYTVVTLIGSDSAAPTDPRIWTQVSGTPVADLTWGGSNTATFTAPGTLAGDTLVFGYSAGGSPQSLVNVTVLYATERAIVGGVQVPVKLMSVAL